MGRSCNSSDRNFKFARCDVVKIDARGVELAVLEGIYDILARDQRMPPEGKCCLHTEEASSECRRTESLGRFRAGRKQLVGKASWRAEFHERSCHPLSSSTAASDGRSAVLKHASAEIAGDRRGLHDSRALQATPLQKMYCMARRFQADQAMRTSRPRQGRRG
jgi:hypothetical protein